MSKNVRVLLLDPLPIEADNVFESAGFSIDQKYDLTEGQLVKVIGDYQVVCLSTERQEQTLTEDVLRTGHKLLAIGVFGSLTTQIDLNTAASMGIPIFTAPYQHQHSVAETVIGYMVLLSRQIGDRSREIHSGSWNKTSTNCREVRGKTLGIVGYGHVGSQLGVLAEALSLRVIFYDVLGLMPIGRAEPRESLESLLAESDFVALNISMTSENDLVFGQKEMEMMKPGAYLINVSHGNAIDLNALAACLKSGYLAGAAIDVFPSRKKPSFECPLIGLPNVILTPSIAGDTQESLNRIVHEVTAHVVRYIQEGGTLVSKIATTGAVNFPNVASWSLKKDSRRIVCIHRNVRGVLKEIDHILSDYNVGKQVLDTKEGLGYLVADVSTSQVTTEIVSQLAVLANCIRTRII